MEAPGGGGGSSSATWMLVRGLCHMAPIALSVAYSNRHTLSRLWHGQQQQEVDEKGRPVTATPAAEPSGQSTTTTTTTSSSSSSPASVGPERRSAVREWYDSLRSSIKIPREEKERDDKNLLGVEEGEEGDEARLWLIQRTIMRMTREGDVEGLRALLDSLLMVLLKNGPSDETDEHGKQAEEPVENDASEAEVEEEEGYNGERKSQSNSDNERHRHRMSRYVNFLFGQERAGSWSRRIPFRWRRFGAAFIRGEGSDAFEADVEDCSPLFIAALNGQDEIVRLLLAHGADPHLRSTQDGVHPLFAACIEGHENVVRTLIDAIDDAVPGGVFDFGSLVGVESDGCTLLMGCCECGHFEMARLLLERGIDVDAISSITGATALFYATQQGHEHIVRLLALDHHCNVNIRKNDGSTALLLAVMSGRVDIVRILLRAGADIEARTREGDTPLTIATSQRSRYPYVYEELVNSLRRT